MKISQKRAFLLCNTGSYGAALARHLRAVGVEVIEINQPEQSPAPEPLVARRPVMAVEMLRMFKLAKASAELRPASTGSKHCSPFVKCAVWVSVRL